MNSMQARSQYITADQQHEALYNKLVTEAGRLFALADKHPEKLEEASSICLTALDVNPSGLQALNLCARIYLQKSDLIQAEHWISRALELKPDSVSALYSAGHIALAAGDLASAESRFEAACKISKVATRSSSSLAFVYLQQGKYLEAFQLYRELVKTQSDDPHIRSKLFESASHMVADFYSVELEQDLLRYLEFEQVDHSQLRGLITSLLHHKLHLSKEGTPLQFDQLASDPLLLSSLKSFYFCDPILERMFITLRQSILFDAAQNMNITGYTLDLAHALACQAQLNEYVWPETEQENKILQGLQDLLIKVVTTTSWQAEDISPALLVMSQYQDVSQNHLASHLNQICSSQWPYYLQDVMAQTLQEKQHELILSDTIPVWNNVIENKVSRAVRQQYEENPYPRWKDIGFNTPTSYQAALYRNFPHLHNQHWQPEQRLQVLVAGCGTGRQTIRLAKYFNDLDILAIDLSRKALAYAKKQAQAYDCENIRFMQADILDIHSLPMQFDVIECSGVLHHMENPEKGLQSLLGLLKKQGLMKIALYSRAAREQVITFRNMMSKLENKPDSRIVRQALLLGQIPGEWNNLLLSPDFYSMSNCRDLLFHEQEHQFDLNEISTLLDNNKLSYIGMVAEAKTRHAMLQEFHEIKDSLDNWNQIEQQNPDIFDGMYQFYCQK
jgi:2-polyprenyl-3-methyl-5-hydroxy-6-metoxy-1,4-benzoquinol methylase